VKCEHCQAEYFYELARIVKGTGHAVYGIGKKAARERAKAAAERKLEKLLDTEREAVPCPDCSWVHSDMARDLRRYRYRWMTILGIVCLTLAAVVAGIGAVFVANDPRERDWVLQHFSLPTASLATIGAALVFLRRVRTAMFDPNAGSISRTAAREPGTPPALRRDSNGRYFIADPEGHELTRDGSIIIQAARATDVPRECCSCLGPADKWRKPKGCDTGTLRFPICKLCVRAMRWKTARLVVLIIAGSAAASWLGAWYVPDVKEPDRIAVAICGTVFLSLLAGVIVALRSKASVRGRSIHRRRGVVRLTFDNARYAEMFAERYRNRLPRHYLKIAPAKP
jgi:hypothetical protein